MLAASVQREILLAENAASVRALVEASERKLTRLGFDLHDGPIQDVAVLGQDVRLFRDQLEVLRGPLSENKLVGGRIEDLEAQLVSLDNELRRLAREAQTASALPERPFPAAIRERIQAFTARTRIRPRLALEGDMGLVSPSQQIALLKVLQEALANVREHAEASAVTVRVSASAKKIAAEIRDDGRGFDVERTLRRTARDGRMGLTSMNERIHLLGGRSRIDSRPGGPTVVSVVLDRWLPEPADPQPSAPERTAPRRRATNAPGRRGRATRRAGDDPSVV
jgi:two-component system nitrate/nitrite sensor histidine kinase NarX